MSGTSLDGLDLVAVDFSESRPQLLYQGNSAYPVKLRESLQHLALNPEASITQMCRLDTQLGQFYADRINAFMEIHNIKRSSIAAIGSHGQTIRHSARQEPAYTLQIGDPNIIAAETGVTVVADFRRRDLACGGQGAPLAPAFHNQVFRSDKTNRVIINIGGIANITSLPADRSIPVTGYDTGPGNTLLDHLSQKYLQKDYDNRGEFSRSGQIHQPTLQSILKQDAFFNQQPPKSTGTDYFSPAWLEKYEINQLSPADTMSTVVELTALSLSQEILSLTPTPSECYVCGGGAHNTYLIERVSHHLSESSIYSTDRLGIHPDWVEAMAFAWLARQTINFLPANLPSVTNAKNLTILGAVFFSNRQY